MTAFEIFIALGIVAEPFALAMLACTLDNPRDAAGLLVIGFVGWVRGIGYALFRARVVRLEGRR